ncbi:MAG TPA: hypothetical protein VKA70_14910 [Blastocatellia bacterium]|nr:hypothetical protein [Blastocatellia bacterium]
MKRRFTALMIAILLINVVAFGSGLSATAALQQTSQASEIERLKQAIAKLEAADKDPNIPEDVKEINRRYLQQRRSELETLLNNRVAGLRRYLEVSGSGLDENQRREIEGLISAAEQDLARLRGGPPSSGTPTAPPPARRRPVSPSPQAELAPQPPPADPPNDPSAPSNPPTPPTTPLAPPTMAAGSAAVSDIPVKDCSKYNDAPETYSLYEKYVCRAINIIKEIKTIGLFDPVAKERLDPNPRAGFERQNDFVVALALIARLDNPDYLSAAEEARTDKQVGGGPQNEGSTSLVVKGSAPTFLGMAVENGALTQSISGTTITFRGNPVGIVQALANKGYLQSYRETENNAFLRVLRPLSFSFSFDTSRGNDQTNTSPGMPPAMPNVFTADRQQLSQITARYEFFNQRDPRNKKYARDWDKFLEDSAIPLTRQVVLFFQSLLRDDPALRQWFEQMDAAIVAASGDTVEQVIKQQFAQLPIGNLIPTTIERLSNLELTFAGYLTARKELLDKIARGGIVALEYTNTRNVNGPNYSNFLLIAEKGAGGNVDASFNGSLTIFDKLPMGVTRRVRDFSFAGQVDAKIGNILNSGDLIFFASGRYERLLEDAMDPMGMMVMETKGDIGVGQIGIKIPIKGTGFRIPISFSFANRTELIKEKEIRGNIGFTFDLDALFSNIKP